jgi:UDP-glucose 4-epimerase
VKKRILVTGGSGFIGSHIVDRHIRRGDEVIILDKTIHTQNIEVEKVTCYKQDLCDTEKVTEILTTHKPDYIHHCAGHTQLRAAIASPQRDAHDNINGTLSLLQALLELNKDRTYSPEVVLFSSTAAVYGGHDSPPFDENLCPTPVNPYGIAKLAAEQYIQWYAKHVSVPSTIFRYANVYGPRQSTVGQAGVVASFMSALHRGKQLKVYGDGTNTRDYVFVKDIVDAHIRAVEKKENGIFNLGTGLPTSTIQLAEVCSSLQEGATLALVAAEVTEQSSSWMDVSKAKVSLGWEAKTSLIEGLRQTYAWYKAQA